MGNSIACCMNVYNDNWALPGALEAASQWASEIYVIHAGPGGKKSNDGTIETLEKWGVRHVFADINDGFGVIRSRLIHESQCEFVLVQDADERVATTIPIFKSEGNEKFPDTKTPNVKVEMINPCFNQIERLRNIIDNECESLDAVRMSRRHWFTMDYTKPAQAWSVHPDWQLRCVRNAPYIGYDPKVKMHERLIDTRSGAEPGWFSGDLSRGPFYDHFSLFFKVMEAEQNSEDAETYNRLEEGCVPKMWLGHCPGGEK